MNGCWKGSKEDWGGVIELEGEGNGIFCEFWSVDGKSGELGRLKGGGVGEWVGERVEESLE